MTTTDLPATPDAPRAAPVTESARIESIDVLRGFALLGILALNIQLFAMVGAAYMNPTAYGDLTGANYWVWFFTHLLGDQKFMTIFSMLFGAGVVLMTSRAEAKTGRSAAVHYRRMAWLILFGLLHAHLIWYGDILYSYGMAGLLAYLFRRVRPAILFIVAPVLLLVPVALMIASGLSMDFWPQEAIDQQMVGWAPTAEQQVKEIAHHTGGFLEQIPHRSLMAIQFQTFMFLIFIMWRVVGLMLLGMALFKLKVFDAARSYGTYAAMAVIGLAIGSTLTGAGIWWNFHHDWQLRESMFYGVGFNYIGSIFSSLGYVGIVMMICKAGVMSWLTGALAAVGRMAFTNYILHSVICSLIFYGHGLGLYGQVERTGQIAIVAGVWVFQLIASPLWLRVFRYGPLEWLWRSLTYWAPQPFRR